MPIKILNVHQPVDLIYMNPDGFRTVSSTDSKEIQDYVQGYAAAYRPCPHQRPQNTSAALTATAGD